MSTGAVAAVGRCVGDLVALADEQGCRGVRFLLDERRHGTESLINPALVPTQGPALVW